MQKNVSIEDYVESDRRKAVRDHNSNYGLMMTFSNDKEVDQNA